MEKAWPEDHPKGKTGQKWDGDNEEDITWLMDEAVKHADKFGIKGT
jgi:hypothetical protein